MCGIAGFITKRVINSSMNFLEEMSKILNHRGPDGNGFWTDNIAYLGHQRLSIIDLDTGFQPMSDHSKRYIITFNGEIYNFLEIRPELEAKGAIFKTKSDTEVILESFKIFGKKCVEKFNGMFAFAIWDKQKQTLFCARDRMGVKPFYYYSDEHIFAFSSEIKSLLCLPFVHRTINWNAFALYLSYNYIPSPQTIFSSIKKLNPGNILCYDCSRNSLDIQQFWTAPVEENIHLNSKDIIDVIREKLERATKLRLVSDVPVGAFLSGGLDSSLTTALMKKFSTGKVHTFSIGFDDKQFDESNYALSVSKKLGTCHHVMNLTPPEATKLEQIICQFDEPFADPTAIPTYYLALLTQKYVKVALSGDGADELFGGYSKFFHGERDLLNNKKNTQLWYILARLWPKTLRGRGTILSKSYDGLAAYILKLQRFTDRKYFPNAMSYIINKHIQSKISMMTSEYIQRIYEESNHQSHLSQLMYVDTRSYLPENCLVKLDRSSMLASLEVRSPFVDYDLVHYVSQLSSDIRIPNRQIKELLKKAAKNILPSFVLDREKKGFDVPINTWLATNWKEYAEYMLFEYNDSLIFNKKELQRKWFEFTVKKRDWMYQLWIPLVYLIWEKTYQPEY
jgi:asparagine synthase (glutamine-hydrolysing)